MICLKNCKKEIDDKDIWKDDLFERKAVADDFSKIITTINQPFVVSVDAPYGSGKSFFLERWQKDLAQDNITVFFNAWSCDFVKNPLIPFIYNFLTQLEEQSLIKYDLKKDINDCLNVITTISNNAISAFSMNAINPKELKDAIAKESFGLHGLDICNYKEITDNITKFKTIISSIVDSREDQKNIYVFVDELERCRPTFAVELLECIKHLFDIEGLVFILGIDRSQLKTTISSIYGADMNGDGYLRRFIDLELTLPEPNRSKFVQMLCNQFSIENKESRFINNWASGYDVFNRYFKIFADAYNFSLREIEQCYTEFNIITKTIPENTLLIMPLLSFLLVIKYKNADLYSKLGREYKDYDTIVRILNNEIKPLIKFDSDNKLIKGWNHFLAIITACFEINLDHKLEILTTEYNKERSDRIKIQSEIDLIISAKSVLNVLNDEYHADRLNVFQFVKNKLFYTSLN